MPNPSTLGSKQQDLQAVKQSVTAGPMSSKAKALKKESKASALPVEQSLASRRAKAVYTAMERSVF